MNSIYSIYRTRVGSLAVQAAANWPGSDSVFRQQARPQLRAGGLGGVSSQRGAGGRGRGRGRGGRGRGGRGVDALQSEGLPPEMAGMMMGMEDDMGEFEEMMGEFGGMFGGGGGRGRSRGGNTSEACTLL